VLGTCADLPRVVAATNPRDPESFFGIIGLGTSATGLRLEVRCSSGRRYQVERISAVSGGTWQIVGAPVLADNSVMPIDVAIDPAATQAFYRVRLVPEAGNAPVH
jgi:hypothetical protein